MVAHKPPWAGPELALILVLLVCVVCMSGCMTPADRRAQRDHLGTTLATIKAANQASQTTGHDATQVTLDGLEALEGLLDIRLETDKP